MIVALVPQRVVSRVRLVTSRVPRGDRARSGASGRRQNPAVPAGAIRFDSLGPVSCLPSRLGRGTGALPSPTPRCVGQVRFGVRSTALIPRQRLVTARARSRRQVPRRSRGCHGLAAPFRQHRQSTESQAGSVRAHRPTPPGDSNHPRAAFRPFASGYGGSVRPRPVRPFASRAGTLSGPGPCPPRRIPSPVGGPEHPNPTSPEPPSTSATSSAVKAPTERSSRARSGANTAVKRTRSAPLRSPLTANR